MTKPPGAEPDGRKGTQRSVPSETTCRAFQEPDARWLSEQAPWTSGGVQKPVRMLDRGLGLAPLI